MYKLTLFLFFSIVAAVIWQKYENYSKVMGFGKSVYHHQPGKCDIIAGTESGSESIVYLENGLALITSGLKFNVDWDAAPWKDRGGKILLFDFNKPGSTTPLSTEGYPGFQTECSPLGISAWNTGKGTWMVYVICSHRNGIDSVEVFRYSVGRPLRVEYEYRIESDTFSNINSLALLGEDEFYFTNLVKGNMMTELQLGWGSGSIGICKKGNCHLIEKNVLAPNGIELSADKRILYVSVPGMQTIWVYQVQDDHSLTKTQNHDLQGSVDNLNLDPVTGNIWGGGLPVLHEAFPCLVDPIHNRCPTQVLMFETKDGLIVRTHEVYSIPDGFLSSAAVYHDKRVLIGSPISHALICDVHYLME